jgi:hypothetical protein
VTVSGTGFGAFRAVDVYFDTTHEALASTNGQGAFSGVVITVPARARPGKHFITGVARQSGRSAQASFLVRRDWAQLGFSETHAGVNPFENVLSVSDASGLSPDWSFQTRNSVVASSAVAGGVAYIGSEDGNLYALNAATGATLWTFTDQTPGADPVMADGWSTSVSSVEP